MHRHELFEIPNLVSLFRVAILPLIGFYLSQPGKESALIATGLALTAGISDGLDGYLARRMNKIGPLGIALDPICDKIFAAGLVTLLIFYREFPIWLAVAIVGRDLLIGVGGLVIMRGEKISTPSNLTGKYAFAALALMLGSYVLKFESGIEMLMPIVLFLLVASLISYARNFILTRRGEKPSHLSDIFAAKILRYLFIAIFMAYFLYQLMLFVNSEYLNHIGG